MKKFKISLAITSAILFAVISAFTIKKNNALTQVVYKIVKVSPSNQPSGSQVTDPGWFDGNNTGIYDTKINTAFTSTELDNAQTTICDASDRVCLAMIKYVDGQVDPNFFVVVRNGDLIQ